jgi:hypothetical protein
MSDEAPLEPLDPELAALLAAERGAPAPGESLDRVWSSLAVGGVVSVAGRGGRAAGGAKTASAGAWAGSQVAAVAAAAFVAGAAVSAGIALATVRAKERVVYVERPAPPAAVESVKTPPPPLSPLSPPVAPLVGSAPLPPTPPSAAASASPLSRERALLDAARSALAAGDHARALALLDTHARTFAKPQLGEEREALAIQALAASGRYDEARARGARFRASTPGSLFMPAIDATLGSIP